MGLEEEYRRQFAHQGVSAKLKALGTDESPNIANTGAAYRQSARSLIECRITRLEERANGLRRLLGALPTDLPLEADEALWQMLVSSPA